MTRRTSTFMRLKKSCPARLWLLRTKMAARLPAWWGPESRFKVVRGQVFIADPQHPPMVWDYGAGKWVEVPAPGNVSVTS